MSRRSWCAYLLFLAACAWGAEQERSPLVAAFTRKTLLTYTPEEIIAVATPFAEYVGERLGRTIQIKYFEQAGHAVLAAKRGEVHFVFSDALDAVRQEDQNVEIKRVATCFVRASGHTTSARKACILVRGDSDWDRIQELRGKRLVVAEKGETISYLYLEKRLAEEKLPRPQAFFAKPLLRAGSQNTAMNMVLSRKADVTCVGEGEFLTKQRLDGRVRAGQLKYVEPPGGSYPGTTAFCLEGKIDDKLFESVQKELLAAHKSEEGDQLLTFLKMQGFMEPKQDETNAVRQLVREVEAVRRKRKATE